MGVRGRIGSRKESLVAQSIKKLCSNRVIDSTDFLWYEKTATQVAKY